MRRLPLLPGIKVIEKIGEGGMSTVWKAMDFNRGEEVAVKILNKELTSNEEDIKLFKSEADTMKMIDHR